MLAFASARVGRAASLLAWAVLVGTSLTSAPCRAELPPAAPANVEPSPEAREQFNVGVSLLQDPDGANYEEAFKAFMRAYTATPSWKILGNLGLSALKIERYNDGIEAYERYLAQAADQLDPAELEQVKRDLNVMKATSGTLVLTVEGANGVVVEDTRTRSVGGPVVNLYTVPASGSLTLRLAGGHHKLSASAAGKSGALELDIKSGETVQKTLSLSEGAGPSAAPGPSPVVASTTAPPARSSGMRTAGLVIGGVGVAALIGGGVTGFIGMSKQSNLEGRCPEKRCEYDTEQERQSFEADRDSLKTMGTLTTVLLLGGGVLTATGATLFVLGGSSSKEQVATTAFVAPGAFGLSARGTF